MEHKAQPPTTTSQNQQSKGHSQSNRQTSHLPSDGLTIDELVQRWRGLIKRQTLANWRSKGQGPSYQKIGGRVLYPQEEVERYERERLIAR